MSSPSDALLDSGRPYEVERGVKTDSYIKAVTNNPIPTFAPSASYAKKPSRSISEEMEESAKVVVKRKPGQVGLTAEELEEYKDDPCWKTARCVLFWLFWLLWLALFVIALLIVIFSPKCAPKLVPNWWQSAIAYNVWVPSFSDSDGNGIGDIDGLISRLDNLRKTGVQTVWPRPFLLSDGFSDAIRDFRALDSKLGVNTDAGKLIKAVHDNGMKMVIDLPLTTTSLEHDWFLRSQAASKEENKDYAKYYTWSNKAGLDANFFSKLKDTSYFHKEGTPKAAVLNWDNAHVKMAVLDEISYWITQGVDGFHLTGIEYLTRSPNFTRPNWKIVAETISDIRNHVETFANESAKEGEEPRKIIVFASLEGSKEKDKRRLVSDLHLNSLVNYELTNVEKNTKICHKNEGNVGLCTYEILADLLLFHSLHDDVIPAWEFGNPFVSRLASRVGSRKHAELLLMVQLMLPGSNAFYYGDELGMRNLPNDTKAAGQQGVMQWDDSAGAGFSSKSDVPLSSDYKNINWERQYNDQQSSLKTFARLSKLRQRDETLQLGQTLMGRIVDGSAFTMARFMKGDNQTAVGTIYVIGVNFASKEVDLPLDILPSLSTLDRASIVAVSSNVDRSPRESVDLSSKFLHLGPDEGVVFKYSAESPVL
ncbi:hypothetical protein PMAYCL1PPCAC_04491 [Pristionchus mayeri]|uniref:alpha-glucosidase n=1 Tax=Pristionchus mayeri TaxID=1317129 RepID=A0AAN5CAT9_9BILA|nr:hypothetical protein PMAYCL1PPCAC_04491 [Pristionchus mayeri]